MKLLIYFWPLIFHLVHHPGLRALWNVSTKVDQIQNKWKLFLEAVSPGIEYVVNWMLLPADLVVSTATCYYLYRVRIFYAQIGMIIKEKVRNKDLSFAS